MPTVEGAAGVLLGNTMPSAASGLLWIEGERHFQLHPSLWIRILRTERSRLNWLYVDNLTELCSQDCEDRGVKLSTWRCFSCNAGFLSFDFVEKRACSAPP